MATAMATTVSTTLPLTNPSCSRARLSVFSYSAAALPSPRCARIHLLVSIPQPGSRHLCPWIGLKHLGVSWRHRSRGCKQRYIGRVHASLFGVGAPEVLVIGVVALLVFGPKGLAEVARNLGKTLRAFQPTIRELQEVSREFKNTLEREIGLDEIPSSVSNTSQSSSFVEENPRAVADPNGTLSTRPYSSEELLKVTEEQLATSDSEPQSQATQLEDQPQGFTPSSSEELLKVTDEHLSASESEPRSQATQLEDQPQGVPDAHSSPEATDATSATQTASPVSASEVAAQMTLVENPENKASET